jgi:hypothetical protein
MNDLTDYPRDADGGFTIRTAGASALAICASVLGSPRGESTAADRHRFHAVLCELLDAARAGGFPEAYADELDAWTLAGKVNGRSLALAHEAVRCAGPDRCAAVATRHGI